jgi:hypothetical protein
MRDKLQWQDWFLRMNQICLMKATRGGLRDELSAAGAGADREHYSKRHGRLLHQAPLLAFFK